VQISKEHEGQLSNDAMKNK